MSRAAPPRALVVDDSEIFAYFAGAVLEQAGYQVTRVASIAEALAATRAVLPDVVCVDYELPDGHGDQLCRRLRVLAGARALWIVMVSADTPDLAARAAAAGADVALAKTDDPGALAAAIAGAAVRLSGPRRDGPAASRRRRG